MFATCTKYEVAKINIDKDEKRGSTNTQMKKSIKSSTHAGDDDGIDWVEDLELSDPEDQSDDEYT